MNRRRLRIVLGFLAAILSAVVAADWAFPPPMNKLTALSSRVDDRDGRALHVFAVENGRTRQPIAAEALPANYRRFLIAIEDRRFARHFGIDPLAVLRAAGQNIAAGRILSGASTLSMQTARLLEPRPRTISAKLIEAARALQLEARMSKDEILSAYATLAPFGGPVEGVRSAAWAWFGRAPEGLTDGEAALLVALPQSPERLRPDRFPLQARAARNRVIDRLERHGALDAAAAAAARAEPMPDRLRPPPRSTPRLAERIARTSPRGERRRATIDRARQTEVARIIEAAAARADPHAQAAAMLVEIADRRVRAYVGAVGPLGGARAPAGWAIDHVRALRSPGSALKPFIYALAFEDGTLTPESLIADRAEDFDG